MAPVRPPTTACFCETCFAPTVALAGAVAKAAVDAAVGATVEAAVEIAFGAAVVDWPFSSDSVIDAVDKAEGVLWVTTGTNDAEKPVLDGEGSGNVDCGTLS